MRGILHPLLLLLLAILQERRQRKHKSCHTPCDAYILFAYLHLCPIFQNLVDGRAGVVQVTMALIPSPTTKRHTNGAFVRLILYFLHHQCFTPLARFLKENQEVTHGTSPQLQAGLRGIITVNYAFRTKTQYWSGRVGNASSHTNCWEILIWFRVGLVDTRSRPLSSWLGRATLPYSCELSHPPPCELRHPPPDRLSKLRY